MKKKQVYRTRINSSNLLEYHIVLIYIYSMEFFCSNSTERLCEIRKPIRGFVVQLGTWINLRWNMYFLILQRTLVYNTLDVQSIWGLIWPLWFKPPKLSPPVSRVNYEHMHLYETPNRPGSTHHTMNRHWQNWNNFLLFRLK